MRRFVVWAALVAVGAAATAQPKPFSIKDVMSAPYALSLTAAPVGDRVAWVENAEGVRNIWVAGANEPAHQVTHYTQDDGQDISGLVWGPRGTGLAYTLGAETGHSGQPANPAHLQRDTERQLWLVKADGSAPTQVFGGGSAPLFTPGGTELFFTRRGKIWSWSLEGDPPAPPAQTVFDRGSASQLTLSPDGKLLAYVSHRSGHSYIGLFDLVSKTLRFVAPSTGNDSAPAFSRDGQQLAWLRQPFTDAAEFAANRLSANPWSVMVADIATLTARAVYQPQANQIGSVIPRFATGNPRLWWAAGTTLLFCSEADGWVHLYAVDTLINNAKALLLTRGKFEVEDVSLSGDGHSVLFASNDASRDVHDADRRHLWKAPVSGAPPSPLTSGYGIEARPAMLTGGRIVAMAASTSAPMHPVWVAADGSMRDVHVATLPPAYPVASLVMPQQVIIRSKMESGDSPHAGHISIHGQVFDARQTAGSSASQRTDNKKIEAVAKRPAIVFFHGGPRRQMLLGYPAMDYYSNAYAMNQYLASRGYIVLSVNYRCGIGYGLEFRQCEHAGADGAAEYNEALAAVEYLRSRGDVDMKRVGIWGGSYGGYFTALALARNSNLFAAGVDFHGVHDWIVEDNREDWLRGTPEQQDAIRKRARASSPMSDIDKWKSPVLLIHGDDDPEVAYNQTPLLADALRARNVHVEELIFPDEVHDFLLHKDWLKAYEATADFFDRMLKPEK